MRAQLKTLEEVYLELKVLRSNYGSRRKFPKELWHSIVRLTKVHSLQEVCRHLEIQPTYLKRKIKKSQHAILDTVDFQEVSCDVQGLHPDTIVIELMSHSGLRARIQGSSTCLNCLSSLFRG
jgi:hypothetical protein